MLNPHNMHVSMHGLDVFNRSFTNFFGENSSCLVPQKDVVIRRDTTEIPNSDIQLYDCRSHGSLSLDAYSHKSEVSFQNFLSPLSRHGSSTSTNTTPLLFHPNVLGTPCPFNVNQSRFFPPSIHHSPYFQYQYRHYQQRRKRRILFNQMQIQQLEKIFRKQRYLSASERDQLSALIGLSPTQASILNIFWVVIQSNSLDS